MSYTGNSWSRYSTSSSPYAYSNESRASSSRSSSAHGLPSYHQSRLTPSTSSSSASSKSSSYGSMKSHPSSPSSYSSRTSPSNSFSSSSGYSSGGSSYLMGHYTASPASAAARDRDRDYRSKSSTGNGSLPSQYSNYSSHQRTYSNTVDRKPSRPSSLYDTRRSLRSFDSEYSQKPTGNAVVHQLTLRPSVEKVTRNDSSVPNTVYSSRIHRDSTSSMKSFVPKGSSSTTDSHKEKKGLFSLRKKFSASLSSLVSSLGSFSYSTQDLSKFSTSSVDLNVIPSSPAKFQNVVNDVEDDDEYSDSVGSGPSSDIDQHPDSSKSENGVSSTSINYRKLYEEVLKENQLLKARLSKSEEDIADLRLKVERVSLTPRISSDDLERREKRALERKLSEMEEELKETRHLRTENQKLRDENGALIRVISKLSK